MTQWTPDAASPPKVELRDTWVTFTRPDGQPYVALGGISLALPRGSFTAIVGPSGCGKSTLLRLVAGLARPSRGEVLVDGRPVRGIDLSMGFLFQQDALLPWRTVYDNVALGLRLRKLPKAEVRERVADWIGRVGLHGFEGHYPAQLSGGMRKRVAIAQTLIYEPPLILMDEPFTHLDAQTRHFMEMDLLALCGEAQRSTPNAQRPTLNAQRLTGSERSILFVTHDLDEAIALADTVVVLSAGPASRVLSVQPVDLPRPRDLLEVRAAPRFGELGRLLWQQLHEEVSRVYGR